MTSRRPVPSRRLVPSRRPRLPPRPHAGHRRHPRPLARPDAYRDLHAHGHRHADSPPTATAARRRAGARPAVHQGHCEAAPSADRYDRPQTSAKTSGASIHCDALAVLISSRSTTTACRSSRRAAWPWEPARRVSFGPAPSTFSHGRVTTRLPARQSVWNYTVGCARQMSSILSVMDDGLIASQRSAVERARVGSPGRPAPRGRGRPARTA